MKIILSRKGFDSSYGGCPSPIAPDGSMISFPIPSARPSVRYSDVSTPWGPMGEMAAHLSKRPALARAYAHLDPDLSHKEDPQWRGALGQVGAAQSHLHKQGVGVGDLFLFFGWFRAIEFYGATPMYVRSAPDMHVLFGYLQVGAVVTVGARPCAPQPWLQHPHCSGVWAANNTLYMASEHLSLNGTATPLPGWGAFPRFSPRLQLSAPQSNKSLWRVPDFLAPDFGLSDLTYHTDPQRWSRVDGYTHVQSVAKGQEFVFDTHNHPMAVHWIKQLVGLHDFRLNCN